MEYVIRPDQTTPDDVTGTPFASLDVRTLISDSRQGSALVMVGQTIYPGNGGTHEHHLHPHAEEVVIVQSGRGWHRIGDDVVRIAAGDVIFVPRGVPHAAGADTPEDLVIYWVLGGAPSLAGAGYVPVPNLVGDVE